jgi:hypothetical protein
VPVSCLAWSASVQWLGKAAGAEQAGAGAALHSRGAVGDFDSPGQGAELTGRVVVVWLQGHAAVAG